MIVFLLIVIAIGVFLISEAGREILGGLGTLALIGGALFVGFWTIVFGYAFFTTQAGQSTIGGIGWLIVIGLLAYLVYRAWKGAVALWKNRKEIPGKIKHWWREKGKKETLLGLRNLAILVGVVVIVFGGIFLWAMWLANH